jgi:3'-phosphoadenosine 5'-phosphosulfate sulfotransferase (PAPS reductase)/FAD synthetase
VSDSFSLLTDQSADVESPSARAMRLSAERMERVVRETQPTHIIATVSGGRDSAAQVELARELGIKIDLILHCRTGTGIPETTKHVVDYYGSLGPDFVMADAGSAYEAYVMRKGFFGVGRQAHNFSYRILKADPMRKAVSSHIRKGRRGIRTLLLNGARAAESDNRQKNLLETRMDKGNLWVNIIHDWTSDDRDRYLQERQVVSALPELMRRIDRKLDIQRGLSLTYDDLALLVASGAYARLQDAAREYRERQCLEHTARSHSINGGNTPSTQERGGTSKSSDTIPRTTRTNH